MLIVYHHVKKYMIYSLTQLKRLYNAISDKKNLNLICFVSFKEPELRNVLLVINFVLTRNDNIFWNFRLAQISHTIFWGAEGLGEGCLKIILIVSCLEWLTCLFLFIMVESEKELYSLYLKMVLIFLVTKVFRKGTMFK